MTEKQQAILWLDSFMKNNEPLVLIPKPLIRLMYDVLKNDEPVRVGKKIKAGDVVLDFYQCGHCKNAIREPWRYCPFCGKKVKWDD